MFKFKKKPWPIHVPAAAVIHEWQALSVLIGRIGRVGNKNSYNQLERFNWFDYKTFLLLYS